MAVAELEDLSEAIRLAGKVDFAALSPGERTEAAEAFASLKAQLAAVEASAVGAFDAALDWAPAKHRSAAHALRHRCRLRGGEAASIVRLARGLRSIPNTHEALAAGAITVAHAHRLVRAASRPEYPEAESFLLGKAAVLSFADFDRAVGYWEQVVDENRRGDDPEGADPREMDRRVHLARTLNGMGRLDGWLDPAGHADVAEALRRIEQEMFEVDWQQAKSAYGDAVTADRLWRTPAQRRADALVEMACRAMTAPADGKRPRPLTIVHVDADTFDAALASLAGAPREPVDPFGERLCELDDGSVLTPGQMLELAILGDVRRLVYSSPGVILDYGRKVRLFTGALREAIEARDRRCDHSGCEIPARRCEIDHTVEWARGGTTSHTNGRAKCSFHHRRHKPGPA